MITADGKRLMNNVLANRDAQIGTHLALGINIVSDASVDGSAEPRTHNRYHSPYIVDEIPIANIGLVDGSPDQLIFAGQAAMGKHFIANNIGLIAVRSLPETSQRTILSVAESPNWNDVNIVTPNNVEDFTEDGYILLNDANSRIYNSPVSLYGTSLKDILAFPFTVHGTGAPTGIAVTLTFTYTDPNNTPYTSRLIRNVVATTTPAPTGYKLSNDTDNNMIATASYNAQGKPTPFLFQGRLNDFENASRLVANGDRISSTTISVTGAGSSTLAFGSVKLTSDGTSNFYRITTSYRRLNRILYKTSTEAYVNAEYKILGVR